MRCRKGQKAHLLWDIPMGFETRYIITHIGISNILWDIPMGFETGYSCFSTSCNFIMRHPYGIWNPSESKNVFKTVLLWDIPMGFETSGLMRQSPLWRIMRHPYGIWNHCQNLNHFPRYWHYETSLWDLKLYRRDFDGRNQKIMRHPYGIWNPPDKTNTTPEIAIMRHPYGIWNVHLRLKKMSLVDYETSLWDLKPHWKIWRYQFLAELWDIPMGFETWKYSELDTRAYIMRHPYGIWNFISCVIFCSRAYYETSLWDLKPLFLYL